MLLDIGNGKSENGACVQGKLAEVLGDHRDHAGVVGAWRHFTEDDVVTFDEKFNAKQPAPTKGGGDLFGVFLRCDKGRLAHCLWLPGFAVIAIDLNVSDRGAKTGAVDMTNR